MNEVKCPKCSSTQLTANKKGYSAGKALAGVVLTGGIGLLGGFIGSKKITITCLSCGNKFKPSEGNIGESQDKQAKLQKTHKAFVFFAIQIVGKIENISDEYIQVCIAKNYLPELYEKLEEVQQGLIEINDKKEAENILQIIEKKMKDIDKIQLEYQKSDFAKLEHLINDYDETIKNSLPPRRPKKIEEKYPGKNVILFLLVVMVIGFTLIGIDWIILGWVIVGLAILGTIVNIQGGVKHKEDYKNYIENMNTYQQKKKEFEVLKAKHPLHNFIDTINVKYPEYATVQNELKAMEEKYFQKLNFS